MTLFPTVDAYAEGSSLPIEMVEGRYEEFRRKHNAKSKFDELREAMKDEANLDLVQALIASPESFEDYVDSSLTLEDAIKWVEGVEVKQRVVGLADGGIKSPAPAGEDMRKLFMKKRSEEHTSELQSLMRISYAVFCLKTTNKLHEVKNTMR